MKIHFEECGLFAELSQELKARFPDLQLCPLKSNSTTSAKNWVFVEETLEPDQLIAEMKMRSLQYILQRNSGRFEKDVLATGILFENTDNYFQSQFSYSADPIISSHLVRFSAPIDKDLMKQETMDFVNGLGSAGVSQAAEAVIEELYMNAMLDAPREAQKKGMMLPAQPSEFFLAQTERYLQISCSDPYGSLDIQKFLSRMKEVYEKGAGSVINMQGGGGAGLGCVILFEHSCALILGVKPGQQTKVTCLISLGISNRQRAQMKKSLLWFEL